MYIYYDVLSVSWIMIIFDVINTHVIILKFMVFNMIGYDF
jgi:hypothetical protein